jgi:hypothetical protein
MFKKAKSKARSAPDVLAGYPALTSALRAETGPGSVSDRGLLISKQRGKKRAVSF